MGTHMRVLSESFPMSKTQQGLDGFQKSLRSCALDKCSLSIGRVMLPFLTSPSIGLYLLFSDVNMAFQQAARNVLFDEETLLQQFKLTIDSKPTGKSKRIISKINLR